MIAVTPNAVDTHGTEHDRPPPLLTRASNIQSARAQTFEGLRVKARALAWCHGGEIDFDVLGIAGGSTDQNLLVGMVSDLARMLTAA